MIETGTIVSIIALVMVLILNVRAFRSDAEAAGHGRKEMLQMAAIWAAIIVGLTLAIRLLAP